MKIDVKPYNIKELAAIYRISHRTMTNWLAAHEDAIGGKVGRYYNALQVKVIFEKLGVPSKIDADE